jgi:DNA-binding transcriptional MerR regulator
VAKADSKQPSPDLSDSLAAKPFFKIGEVAKLLDLKPHVLRYWESEFPSLQPKKNPSGQRIYAKADIEAIVEIKNLLYNERYTISGAKRLLAHQQYAGRKACDPPAAVRAQALGRLKSSIHELLRLLNQSPSL